MINSWRKYAAETYKVEQRFLPLIQRVLNRHISSFSKLLRSHGKDYAVNSLNLELWNEELYPIVHSLYKSAGLAGAKRAYLSLKDSGGQKFTGMGRNEIWTRNVLEYLKLHLLNKAVLPISETTKDFILKILSEGVEQGWSIDEMVSRLENKEYTQARARTITRTEVIRASNVGHVIGAQSYPYLVDKKWIAAHDHRTRHSHRSIANHVTDENGRFKVERWKGKKFMGYDYMKFPGDPDASPENTINCRCGLSFIPKRDRNGRLIPRSTTPASSGATSLITNALLASTFASIVEEAFSD